MALGGSVLADSANKAITAMEAYTTESKNLITSLLPEKVKLRYGKDIDESLALSSKEIKKIRNFEGPGPLRSRHIMEVVEAFFNKQQEINANTKKEVPRENIKNFNINVRALLKLQEKLTDDLQAELNAESGDTKPPKAVPAIDSSPYEEKGIYDR